MADTHWTNGAGTNVWSTAGNWDNGVPTTADNAFVGSRSNANITGATVACPLKLEFADSYTGTVGSAGTPLLFSSVDAASQVNVHGSGKYYLGVTGAISLLRMKVRTRNKATDAVNLYCAASGVIASLYALMGKINLETATVTTLWVDWITHQNADVSIDIKSGAAVTTIEQSAGYVVSNDGGGITTHRIHGGVAQYNLGAITTAHVQNGTLIYSSTGGGAAATIGTLVVFPRGIVDMTRTNDQRIVTTTYIMAGGTVDVTGVANSVAFTNAPVVSGNSVGVRGANVAFTQLN